ncbi:WXG100 family type VII secretion target [Microbacterium sp. STN6]|uniref:WXG100 family type VII secretion target n=1 Tax=Microbacterium sp. STN6 TaxID=2995588 RepID=UPI002260EAC0|nr:WXG100 family type VII secretion target [Microbacterium sp. STN6]MCX7523400.1 WXG100 family type VII secretion target [Microbacterium sp. STN6]
MSRFQVDSEAVLSTTGAVRGSMDRIRAEVGGLHGQLTNLQGAWTGQAATAFQAVITDWNATQQRVEESLAAINHALGQAAQQYAEIEAANTRLFSR